MADRTIKTKADKNTFRPKDYGPGQKLSPLRGTVFLSVLSHPSSASPNEIPPARKAPRRTV